jgi:hypothetical protein
MLRLDEPIVRLAHRLADRCGVTVPELIEALLLGLFPNDEPGDAGPFDGGQGPRAPAAPRPGHRAAVISLDDARRRRAQRPPAIPVAPSREERTEHLMQRAREARARAEAARAASARVREQVRQRNRPPGR